MKEVRDIERACRLDLLDLDLTVIIDQLPVSDEWFENTFANMDKLEELLEQE